MVKILEFKDVGLLVEMCLSLVIFIDVILNKIFDNNYYIYIFFFWIFRYVNLSFYLFVIRYKVILIKDSVFFILYIILFLLFFKFEFLVKFLKVKLKLLFIR